MDAGEAARQESVRGPGDRVGADRLGDAGRQTVEDGRGRLGRDIARGEARAARGEHDAGAGSGELGNGGGDLVTLVGDDAACHLEAFGREQLDERSAAAVLADAVVDTIRDGEHRRCRGSAVGRCGGRVGRRAATHASGSFVFSSSLTSSMTIPLSTALAMS